MALIETPGKLTASREYVTCLCGGHVARVNSIFEGVEAINCLPGWVEKTPGVWVLTRDAKRRKRYMERVHGHRVDPKYRHKPDWARKGQVHNLMETLPAKVECERCKDRLVVIDAEALGIRLPTSGWQ